MHTTPITLLERLQPRDQEAWTRFVGLYTPLLFYWALQCGLQAQDAADLTQDVFTTLFQKLPEFRYDQHRSFRAWLRTVTLNHWRDRQRRVGTRPLPSNAEQLDELGIGGDHSLLEEDEYRRQLITRALGLMRADFQKATWNAFWKHGIEGRAAAEVAAELGMSVAAVYGAKFRVLTRLRQELQGLLD